MTGEAANYYFTSTLIQLWRAKSKFNLIFRDNYIIWNKYTWQRILKIFCLEINVCCFDIDLTALWSGVWNNYVVYTVNQNQKTSITINPYIYHTISAYSHLRFRKSFFLCSITLVFALPASLALMDPWIFLCY